MLIGGLKGYEMLLSLSKDIGNPKLKPLLMAVNWNERNKRMANFRSRDNWYKRKQEVDPPADT